MSTFNPSSQKKNKPPPGPPPHSILHSSQIEDDIPDPEIDDQEEKYIPLHRSNVREAEEAVDSPYEEEDDLDGAGSQSMEEQVDSEIEIEGPPNPSVHKSSQDAELGIVPLEPHKGPYHAVPPPPPQDLDEEEDEDDSENEYQEIMQSAIKNKSSQHPLKIRVEEIPSPSPDNASHKRKKEKNHPSSSNSKSQTVYEEADDDDNSINSQSDDDKNEEESDDSESDVHSSKRKKVKILHSSSSRPKQSSSKSKSSSSASLPSVSSALPTALRQMKYGKFFINTESRPQKQMSEEGEEDENGKGHSAKRNNQSKTVLAPGQFIIPSSMNGTSSQLNQYNCVMAGVGGPPQTMVSSQQNNPFEIAKRLVPVSLYRNDDWIMQIEKEHILLGCPPCFLCLFRNKQSKHSTLFQQLVTKFNTGIENCHSMEEFVDMIFRFHQDNFMPIFEKNAKIKDKNQFVFSRFNIYTCCRKTLDNPRRLTYIDINDINLMMEQIKEHHLNQYDPVSQRLYIDDNAVTQFDKLNKLRQNLFKSLKTQGSGIGGFGM